MGVAVYLDIILVPLSLFITIGYHVYLCHAIKNKPSRTTYGIDRLRRTAWGENLNQVPSCVQFFFLNATCVQLLIAYVYSLIGNCLQLPLQGRPLIFIFKEVKIVARIII